MSALNYRHHLHSHNNNSNSNSNSQQYQPNIGAAAPATMTSQRFCLRWNNHQSNLLSVFDQLLHDESFVDVTLAVEGQLLRAHKMVLSACSPYFQALFVNHPDKHPIVILKDVPYSDMKSLLDFMYRGEVSVDQDRLTAFLRVAESLRIKGLTEVNEEKCDIPSITSSLMQSPHHQQQNTSVPNLHRIQHPHKRFSTGASSIAAPSHIMNPLLGSALLQPKRKRGRPRKLSGSSNGTPGAMGSPSEDFDNRVGGDLLLQGSPEMLEVKMGMDGFGTGGGNTSDSSTGGGGNRDGRDADDETKVKEEEPIAGTSKEQDMKSQDDYASVNDGLLTVQLVPTRLQEVTVIMSSSSQPERCVPVIQSVAESVGDAGVHFLMDDQDQDHDQEEEDSNPVRSKSDLLEYFIRDDGSVTCKLCGEVLASRTHWYRHKYKLHVSASVVAPSICSQTTTSTVMTTASTTTAVATITSIASSGMSPSPLFKCVHCNVFFKSRKGYMGHVSARHSTDPALDDDPVVETPAAEIATEPPNNTKVRKSKETCIRDADWEQQREKEEKLVADIIDRVRRECEAQGAVVSRRGYSRRSTVMNTCN